MHPIRLAVRVLGAAALCALIAAALPSFTITARAADEPAAMSAPALDPANLDPTCAACDDFYQYATGGWRKAHTIPAGHPSWGSFDELLQHNREAMRTVLENAAKTNAPAGSDEQKLGTFYRACMDEDAIERAGTAPIDPLLAQVARIDGVPALVTQLAALQSAGVNDGLRFESESDNKDSSRTIASLGLGGLGLPDRDYYLKDDARTKTIQSAYRDYVATQLRNLGEDASHADADAGAIVALEAALAKVTPPRADLRDPNATYHPTPVAELAKLGPQIDWNAFFAPFRAPRFDTVDIAIPDYVRGYEAQLGATPLSTWKSYLRFHVVDAYANALPKRFADASFAFRSGVLAGVKEQLPRWQRCTSATDTALRTPLGKAYVAANFPPAAKARAKAMVDNLQGVLADDITTLDWMSPQTKRRAVEKLQAFTKKIGYPDQWESYDSLSIPEGAPYAALLRTVRGWDRAVDVARIGKPTDRTLWGMTPPTVNAYYNPSNNEIVFPAGILQSPFFDAGADDAVNYGAVGAVIGHEMTHGFDDEGRQFDAKGDLADWWTPQDAANFGKRAQCIVDEYNGLEVLPGVHQNGRLVQGEAIADLGGTTIAFKAFQRTAEYRAHRKIDGFTPEQRFFLAYAQVWRSLQNDAYTRQLVTIDPHPNDRLRVIGTLSNMPEFRQAFACAANAKMVRADRCQIW
ncbi:MAG TPA: M13 family metallopeptidase [Candidatus Limnocylindria bacterium]|nr:M13 family metallopeptidase [Candidatus Limnocylindria bacterium]